MCMVHSPFAAVPWLCAIVRHMLYMKEALEGQQGSAAAAMQAAPATAAQAAAAVAVGGSPALASTATLPVHGGEDGEGPYAAGGASTHSTTVGGAGGRLLEVAVVGAEGLPPSRPRLAPSVCAEALASWRSFLVREVQVRHRAGALSAMGAGGSGCGGSSQVRGQLASSSHCWLQLLWARRHTPCSRLHPCPVPPTPLGYDPHTGHSLCGGGYVGSHAGKGGLRPFSLLGWERGAGE